MSAPETPEIVAQALASALASEDVVELQTLAQSTDKLTSKAAKRALHRLRSRGVTIPDGPASRPTANAIVGREIHEAREPVQATTYDSSGQRALFVPLKARLGFTLHVGVLSDESGVVSLGASELSRKQTRAAIAELPAETRELLRELTPARAAALITEALALSPGSENAARARELLRSLPEPEPAPRPATATPDEASLRESAKLFDSAPFRVYLPPREVLMQISQKLEEVTLSPLLVDEAQRLEQLRHTLERATAEFFGEENRARYAARLLDAAELFDRNDPASASQARGAAAALRGDRPVHEIPFARALFERIFNLQADLQAAVKSMARPETGAMSNASAGGGLPDGGLILPP